MNLRYVRLLPTRIRGASKYRNLILVLFAAVGMATLNAVRTRKFAQHLALIGLKLSNLGRNGGGPAANELNEGFEDARKSIAAVADDLRDLSHQLHPGTLEILGLVRSLQGQCDEFQRVRGIETTFEAFASDDDASLETAICLYRVLQEGLQNIAKHSGSANASMTLARQANLLEMRIRDEGTGFPAITTNKVGVA